MFSVQRLAWGKKPSKSRKQLYNDAILEDRTERVRKLVERAQHMDCCFVMDATSSMKPYIDSVRNKFKQMVASIRKDYSHLKLRVALVAYRDYNDADPVQVLDFTSSEEDFVKYLEGIQAIGGGDTCEDVFTGLEAAEKLSWKSHNRVLFHVADAPCHGTEFHGPSYSDNWPKGDKKERDIKDILQRLQGQAKTNYFFSHLNNSTEMMIRKFMELTRPGWLKADHVSNPDALVDMIEDTISATLSLSMATLSFESSGCDSRSLKISSGFEVDTTPPGKLSWSVPLHIGRRHAINVGNMSVKKMLGELEKGGALEVAKPTAVDIRIQNQPFSADGASRWPFHAQCEVAPLKWSTGEEVGTPAARHMVVKSFKKRDEKHQTEARYMDMMQQSAICIVLALDFNARIKKLPKSLAGCMPLYYNKVSVVSLPEAHYTLEEYMDGDWVKWINNTGGVQSQRRTATACATAAAHAPLIMAFCHYTFHRTDGKLLIADVQGCVKKNDGGSPSIHLCDPAVQSSRYLRAVPTNLRRTGFELFAKSHVCNHICKALKLPEMPVLSEE